MEKRKDVFDKIIECKIFVFFQPFYYKNKEILLYLFFGAVSFVVSVASYFFLSEILMLNELVSNIISWLLAVCVAFVTNHIWVFERTVTDLKSFIVQITKFFSGRVATLVLEEIILVVFVVILAFPNMLIKVVAQVVVIILNYVISKLFVFRNKNQNI